MRRYFGQQLLVQSLRILCKPEFNTCQRTDKSILSEAKSISENKLQSHKSKVLLFNLENKAFQELGDLPTLNLFMLLMT